MSTEVRAEKARGQEEFSGLQLDRLRCPHCVAEGQAGRGTLSISADGSLLSGCGRTFAVRDGIPVLMPNGEGIRAGAVRGRGSSEIDLSVIVPALHEGSNLATLLPGLRAVLDELLVRHEILIVTNDADADTVRAATESGARVLLQRDPGYGGAVRNGFEEARGEYLLTLDADLSHQPTFVPTMWRRRQSAEVTIGSRYVPGGSAHMPLHRYVLSRILNTWFSRGLSLKVRDMSSGFRLLKAETVSGGQFQASGFDLVQEVLVRAFAEGWRVQEIPMEYRPRAEGSSHARILRFGMAYIQTFWSMWKLRNSILAADYDDRAYDSPIPLQRYWQRMRFRHITDLIAGEGPVLDVGCGSSRIIGALPAGSIASDILLRKLRYARKFERALVQASGFCLPFADTTFSCVLCSQVIEHVPKSAPVIDELCRVLAPGGRLVLGTPDYASRAWVFTEKMYGLLVPGGYADEHIAHYTHDELIEMLRERGLVAEENRYILRGELILAFRKPA